MSNIVGLFLSIANAKIHIKQDYISILKLQKFLDKKTEAKAWQPKVMIFQDMLVLNYLPQINQVR